MGQHILDLLQDYYFWGLVGFSVGTGLVLYDLTRNGVRFPAALLIWTAAVYGGLLGARLLFIFETNPRLLFDDPLLALAFWQGGLAWQGGAVLGSFVGLVGFRLIRRPAWSNLGCGAPGLALSHAVSRVGCLMSGCCYGAPTAFPWAIYSRKLDAMVHPTQVYSMVCELLTAVALQVLWRKPARRKYLIPAYGLLSATHRFVTEAFRGTPAGPELFPGLRFYQSTSLLLFVASACVFVLLKSRKWGIPIAAVLIALTGGALWINTSPLQPMAPADLRGKCLVVSRSMFAKELTTWKTEKERLGLSVVVNSWEDTPSNEGIRDWITGQGPCDFIFIVGGCQAAGEPDTPWEIPTFTRPSLRGKEGDESLADSVYGDLDRDGCPDVAVGRLPVRTVAELRRQFAKEESRKPLNSDRRRAVVWSGAAKYQAEMHAVAQKLASSAPPWIDACVMSGYEACDAGGHSTDQAHTFLQELSTQPFVSMIVSHGSYRSVTPAVCEGHDVSLCVEDIKGMDSTRPSGPLFILACDAGKLALPALERPCLSEAFLTHSGGPVAVVSASSTVCSVTNCLFAKALIDELGHSHDTIGGLFLAIQRKLYELGGTTLEDLLRDDELLASLVNADPDKDSTSIPGLLRNEVLSYNLLGDPTSALGAPSAQ